MMDNDYRSSNTPRSAIANIGMDRRIHRKRAVEVEESATTEAAVVAALSSGDVGRLRAMCIAEAESPGAAMWRRVDGRRRSDGVANQLWSVAAAGRFFRNCPPRGKR